MNLYILFVYYDCLYEEGNDYEKLFLMFINYILIDLVYRNTNLLSAAASYATNKLKEWIFYNLLTP